MDAEIDGITSTITDVELLLLLPVVVVASSPITRSKASELMKKGFFASLGGSAIPRTR